MAHRSKFPRLKIISMTNYEESASNPLISQTNTILYDFFRYSIKTNTLRYVMVCYPYMLEFILIFGGFPIYHQNEFGKILMPQRKSTDMSPNLEWLKILMVNHLIQYLCLFNWWYVQLLWLFYPCPRFTSSYKPYQSAFSAYSFFHW